MRVLAVLAVVLAGCAAATPRRRGDHAAEVEACAAAVAAHVGKGAEAVAARWTGADRAGIGIVTVSDAQGAGAERVHTCEVDGAGRVLAIRHPGRMSLEYRLRVYYEDTDAGGIVYYANYLKFIERARTEALIAAGMSQTELKARLGIVFAVRELAVSYLAPARLEDQLVVTTRSGRRAGRGW